MYQINCRGLDTNWPSRVSGIERLNVVIGWPFEQSELRYLVAVMLPFWVELPHNLRLDSLVTNANEKANREKGNCLLSDLAFEWQRGWRWPCFDTDLSVFVVYMHLASVRTTLFTQQNQSGLYQNKVTSSLAAIQRPSQWADNCKMVYWLWGWSRWVLSLVRKWKWRPNHRVATGQEMVREENSSRPGKSQGIFFESGKINAESTERGWGVL